MADAGPGTFSFDPAYSDRGYTGHEHIDHLGLVNMNGRLYDPELGKFLSADPTTQFPESTQGWNRYAYCGNNPLSYTDPSGFSFLKSLLKLVGIVMSVFAPQFTPLWQQLLWSFAAGFLSSGGNLQGGLMAMVTLGVDRWAGAFARAGPAVPGATPGFNPNLMSLGERAAEEAAKRSTSDQILEVARRAVEQRVWDDGSGRTNADRKMDAGADTPSYAALFIGWWNSGEHVARWCGYGCNKTWDGDPNSAVAPTTEVRTNGEQVWAVVNVALAVSLYFEGAYPAIAARGTTTLYRAVSTAEHADIVATGALRAGSNSYATGKFFAESAEHAAQWGTRLEGAGNFRIIEATFPRSAADQFMRWERLDGIGPARFGTFEQIGSPTIRPWPGSP